MPPIRLVRCLNAATRRSLANNYQRSDWMVAGVWRDTGLWNKEKDEERQGTWYEGIGRREATLYSA